MYDNCSGFAVPREKPPRRREGLQPGNTHVGWL